MLQIMVRTMFIWAVVCGLAFVLVYRYGEQLDAYQGFAFGFLVGTFGTMYVAGRARRGSACT